MEREKANVQGFLAELSALSEKYQIYIGGCGCCDSPYLYFINEENKCEDVYGNLMWDGEKYS